MFGVDFPEVVIILGLALIVLGPKKLPHAAAQIGRWLGRARAMARQFRDQWEQEVNSVQHALDTRPPPPPPNPAPSTFSPPEPPPGTILPPDAAMAAAAAPEVASPSAGEGAPFSSYEAHPATPLWTDPGVDQPVPAPSASDSARPPVQSQLPLGEQPRSPHSPSHSPHSEAAAEPAAAEPARPSPARPLPEHDPVTRD